MLEKLLYSLVFLLSFSSAFNLARWIPLWMLPCILIFTLAIISLLSGKYKFPKKAYVNEDYLLILLIIGVILSTTLNHHPRSNNYILAYTFIFGVLYLFFKGLFCKYCRYKTLLKINTLAVIFVTVFCLIDFLTYNFLGIDVQSWIPNTNERIATYAVATLRVRRSYGFSSEPTILALYFNTMGSLAIYSLWNTFQIREFLKWGFTAIFILAYLTTFSAAGFAGLIVAVPTCLLLIELQKPNLSRGRLRKSILVILLAIIVSFVYNLDGIFDYFEGILGKVSLMEFGETTRTSNWMRDLSKIVESPIFGHGMGYLSSNNMVSSINWYIFLTLEGGLISSLPIISFIVLTFARIYSSSIPGKFFYMFGLLSGAIHYIAISTFFHPAYWILLIFYFVHRQAYGKVPIDVQTEKSESQFLIL